MVNFILYKAGKLLVLILPLKAGYLIAVLICRLQFRFSSKDRNAVIYNLKRVVASVPEREIRILALKVFENFGKYLVDFFRFSKLNDEFIKEKVNIINREYLDSAIKNYPGVIFLSGHIGNWELGACLVSKLGCPVNVVALSHVHKKVNNLFNRQRAYCGTKVIPIGFALRQCYRLLKEKGLVAFLGDRDFGNSGKVFKFCSSKAQIPLGPAEFALKTGAVILPAFSIREKDDKFSLFIEKPIPAFNTDGSKKDRDRIITEYLQVIETYIKKYPSQWYMFQPFFLE